jgi:predicted small metal-binding protein
VSKEVLKMKKRLGCRDVGVDCDFVACGKTEEEVFQKPLNMLEQAMV